MSLAAEKRHSEIWSAIDKCKSSRRGGGVKGGGAAERSEGTLDAAEHRAIMTLAMALVLRTERRIALGLSRSARLNVSRPSATGDAKPAGLAQPNCEQDQFCVRAVSYLSRCPSYRSIRRNSVTDRRPCDRSRWSTK